MTHRLPDLHGRLLRWWDSLRRTVHWCNSSNRSLKEEFSKCNKNMLKSSDWCFNKFKLFPGECSKPSQTDVVLKALWSNKNPEVEITSFRDSIPMPLLYRVPRLIVPQQRVSIRPFCTVPRIQRYFRPNIVPVFGKGCSRMTQHYVVKLFIKKCVAHHNYLSQFRARAGRCASEPAKEWKNAEIIINFCAFVMTYTGRRQYKQQNVPTCDSEWCHR